MLHFNSVQKQSVLNYQKEKLEDLTFGWMRSNEQLSLIKPESQTTTSIRIICNYTNVLWIDKNKWFYPFI